MKNTILILPGCDDTNRGDQALIWETVSLAKKAGYQGDFYMIASAEHSRQSKAEEIHHTEYILPHPSVYFKKNNNIQYGVLLKIKWAMVSLLDGIKAITLLSSHLRRMTRHLYSPERKKTIERFEEAEVAFVKGGGFLHSYGGWVSTYVNFYNLYHIMLALSMKKKVYVMPNSFGPFLSPGTGWMIKRVLSRCEFVSTRESISRKMLIDELRIDSELYPDLAFYLEMDERLTMQQREKLSKVLNKSKNVAITVRPYRFPDSQEPQKAYENYKAEMCKFIEWLSDKGYHSVLIEHTFSETEHERDISCIADIEKLIPSGVSYSVYSDLSLNCRKLKYVYSQFDYIVGTRFHSVIFSLASKVPAIAVAYGGNKGLGIMRDIGLEDYVISINDLNVDVLTKKFGEMVENHVEIENKLDNYNKFSEEKKIQLIKSLGGGQK